MDKLFAHYFYFFGWKKRMHIIKTEIIRTQTKKMSKITDILLKKR